MVVVVHGRAKLSLHFGEFCIVAIVAVDKIIVRANFDYAATADHRYEVSITHSGELVCNNLITSSKTFVKLQMLSRLIK